MNKYGNITLYNGDCLEILREFPDKAFDLAIVDPPYGLGIDGQKKKSCKKRKHNRKFHEKRGWDEGIPSSDYFIELFRVSKNQIIWGANYFVENLTQGKKGWICWYKGQQGLTMSDCELAYSSFDCPTRVVTINRVELLKQKTIHPTEKPIKLYKWILKNYANPGDKIIDTHLGSGSICIAAHDLDFEMIGIEIDSVYYENAKQRLINHQKQLLIF